MNRAKVRISRKVAGFGLSAAAFGLILVAGAATLGRASASEGSTADQIGQARAGEVTVALAPAARRVRVSEAKVPGRPIVVLDPGHGGHDPGALAASTTISEKQLTLALARELRDELVRRGRVRVALTREQDVYLGLDERAGIARQLGATLFLSLHMDSAPNPLARGASIYSLSDVASDEDAARFARSENARASAHSQAADSADALLSDLGDRTRMTASAELAMRLIGKSAGRIELRPEPHRFASFHVLRRAGAPAALFEAGYLSNADDELLLRSPEYRAKIVAALAQAIEADVAFRIRRG